MSTSNDTSNHSVNPIGEFTIATVAHPANQPPTTLVESLQAEGQEHLLQFWNELNDSSRKKLQQDIESVDVGQINRLFSNFGTPEKIPTLPEAFSEPAGFGLKDTNPRFSREEAKAVGEQMLRSGTVGVVIVAGGQGTRLGFAHPKGMFPIGPVSNSTLFEILLGKVQAVEKTFGTTIPVYLMTSPATHTETVEFIEAHQRFGMAAEDLQVFCQGTMPAVDMKTGKLLLTSKDELFRSPDGHGGMLAALDREGCFSDMKARGIEQLFYMQVDNALVDVASPEAIGFHVLTNSDATTMVIRKTDPMEKVGNVAVLNGKTQIVEYSDLPEDAAKLTRDDGQLQLWAGNVAVHVWDVSFLREQAHSENGLPFHYAQKKVPFVTENGETIKPTEPNGIKFERFIFDLLPEARNSIVIEVERESYFAPLKNPAGTPTDSPEYVQNAMKSLHRSWLVKAGAMVADDVIVEIAPSFAVNAEQVAAKVEPGTRFDKNQVLE